MIYYAGLYIYSMVPIRSTNIKHTSHTLLIGSVPIVYLYIVGTVLINST